MPVMSVHDASRGLAMIVLLGLLWGCGGGGGGSDPAPADGAAGDGGNQDASGDWTPGEFEPAKNFEAQCEEPRTGINPDTGQPYPDQQGSFVDENNWLRSWSHDLYLWYDEIIDQNPADFDTPAYFDLMKTEELTPSNNPKDQFHFLMPTDEWRALSQSGVAVGYGVQWAVISPSPPRQVVVAYVKDPNSPAAAGPASLARGAEILEVDGVDVVRGGSQTEVDTINAALFPSAVGEPHEFTVRDAGASETRTFTMEAVEVETDPVQNVHVQSTIDGPVGYMLFTDHIAPSEAELIEGIEKLRDEAVVDLVLDIRYNGGGFLDIASELAFMIAGEAATSGKTFDLLEFNDKHTVFNPVTGQRIEPMPFHQTSRGFGSMSAGEPLPSLNLDRVFVLTGPGTCSASETIMNGLRGIDVDVIQIGSTTCGKPYGFYPTDNCGTTYFSIQFRGINDKDFGDYADGFSPANLEPFEGTKVPGCAVADDFTHALGDPEEGRFAAALAYRLDQSCPAASSFGTATASSSSEHRPLSAVNGDTPKTPWLENRILGR